MNEENLEPITAACGEPAKPEANKGEKQSYPIGRGMKFLFYMLSLFFFPGIVFGAVFYSKDDPDYRHVGKNCIYIALLPFIFYLFIVIIALLSGQVGNVFGDSIKDVPY
ncbi:MAG: hypothetical protein AB1498_04120 [bacterium]